MTERSFAREVATGLFISTFFMAPHLLRTNEHIRVDIAMSRINLAKARAFEYSVLATIIVRAGGMKVNDDRPRFRLSRCGLPDYAPRSVASFVASVETSRSGHPPT